MHPQLSRTDIARALAAMRRRVETTCPVCGKTMTGMRHRRTCSDACRSKAYRLRKEAKTTNNDEETPR